MGGGRRVFRGKVSGELVVFLIGFFVALAHDVEEAQIVRIGDLEEIGEAGNDGCEN